MIDWWLYLKTELPDDSIHIAKQSGWGHEQLAKVLALTHNENNAGLETGQSALYGGGIDINYTPHSIGIPKAKFNPCDPPTPDTLFVVYSNITTCMVR